MHRCYRFWGLSWTSMECFLGEGCRSIHMSTLIIVVWREGKSTCTDWNTNMEWASSWAIQGLFNQALWILGGERRTMINQEPVSTKAPSHYHTRDFLSAVMSLAFQCQKREITEKCKFCESPSRDKFNEAKGREHEEVIRQWRALTSW